MTSVVNFAPLLQRFFTERLMQQRRVSPHTISSYRDTFRQLLKFTQHRLHKSPSTLGFEEIDAPLVVAFLDHLEKSQGLSVRSRNLRLTAIHSLFRYAAFELPTHSAQIQRVLAIPPFHRVDVDFDSHAMQALRDLRQAPFFPALIERINPITHETDPQRSLVPRAESRQDVPP